MAEDRDVKYRVHRDGASAHVVLSNPAKHNCFDDVLIRGLTEAFTQLAGEADIRAVILRAEGKSFSAGADLNWMKRMAGYSREENLQDALALAGLLRTIDRCPKPVIGLVQGPAYGGGVGLAACCDIAIAAPEAKFALTEVKLGLIPAAISPFVAAAIGARAARRYFLTGEPFDAAEAHRLGLVHELVGDTDALLPAGERLAERVAKNGPVAVAEAKDLIFSVDRPYDDAVMQDTAARIARVRASAEGRDGVSAFLEKRAPAWTGG